MKSELVRAGLTVALWAALWALAIFGDRPPPGPPGVQPGGPRRS